MAIHIHAYNFLQKHRSALKGKSVLTIGRQELLISSAECENFQKIGSENKFTTIDQKFCEAFLIEHFQVKDVSSIDYSVYESPTKQHDLNTEVPPDLHEKYDVIIDIGCLDAPR